MLIVCIWASVQEETDGLRMLESEIGPVEYISRLIQRCAGRLCGLPVGTLLRLLQEGVRRENHHS